MTSSQDTARRNRRAAQAVGVVVVFSLGYGVILAKSTGPAPIVIHLFLGAGILLSIVELAGWWARRGKAVRDEKSKAAWEEDKPPRITEKGSDAVLGPLHFVETADDYWWQAIVHAEGANVEIRMAGNEQPDLAILGEARKLAKDWESFSKKVNTMLAQEAQRVPDDSEDLAALTIDAVVFSWPGEPTYAELYFSGAPSGGLWCCGCESGIVFGLSVSGR